MRTPMIRLLILFWVLLATSIRAGQADILPAPGRPDELLATGETRRLDLGGGVVVAVSEVGRAHTRGSLVAEVPSDRVVFASDVLYGGRLLDGHHGERCSFDAFLDRHGLTEPALRDLAVIVRGADTDRHDLHPVCAGLVAVSLGLSCNFSDDHEMLGQGRVIYDALYAWLRHARGEAHTRKSGG